eukprot:m51a1_g42 hypothetical protein (257) ;mRNA; r:152098-152921
MATLWVPVSRDFLPELDDYCTDLVLQHLSRRDLASASLVCRSWHRTLRSHLARGTTAPAVYSGLPTPCSQVLVVVVYWLLVLAFVPLPFACVFVAKLLTLAAVFLASMPLRITRETHWSASDTLAVTGTTVVTFFFNPLFGLGPLLIRANWVGPALPATTAAHLWYVQLVLKVFHAFVCAHGISRLLPVLCSLAGCAAAATKYAPGLPVRLRPMVGLIAHTVATLELYLMPSGAVKPLLRGVLIVVFTGLTLGPKP